MPGRSGLKLTPQRQKIIVEKLREGLPLKYALAGAKISLSAHYGWIKRSDPAHPTHGPRFLNYRLAVEKAKADFIESRVEIVNKHAKNTPAMATWMLERRAPDEFASRSRQDINVHKKDTKRIEVDLRGVSIEQMVTLLGVAEKAEQEALEGQAEVVSLSDPV